MQMPTQYRPAIRSNVSTAVVAAPGQARITPQLRVCTPCVQVGGGRWCVNIPVIGRKCFNVPSLGRWKACCKTTWTPPFVSCGISHC